MHRAFLAGLVLLHCGIAIAEPARDTPTEPTAHDAPALPPAPAAHANPRFKLAYRRFVVANLDATTVPLQGGQLDLYPVSRRFFRLGLEGEGGVGEGSLLGGTAALWYALGGLSIGFQYPARLTPFVEGRVAAGALGGSLSGTIPLDNGSSLQMSGVRAGTVLFIGGVDAGIELYTAGRFYLSAAIGWAHPVWLGPDLPAMQADPTGGLRIRPIANDTITFKVGVGI